MPRKKQVSDIKRKSLSFDLEDPKQKLVYDFLEKLDRKQTFFFTNVICSFLQKNNILDIDALSKKDIERLVIASAYPSADFDVLSSYLNTMGMYAGQLQMQAMPGMQMMPNVQMVPGTQMVSGMQMASYPMATAQTGNPQSVPLVQETPLQEVTETEPEEIVQKEISPSPILPTQKKVVIPVDEYEEEDDEEDILEDDDEEDIEDNDAQKKQILSAINTF